MFRMKEQSLEWSIKHLTRFYDSDFFPNIFEFSALRHNWGNVKDILLRMDYEKYSPKSPRQCLAFKSDGTFRVAHQLDPLDSLAYTSLVYDFNEHIEKYRIPESEEISFSYRIKPDPEGSFFAKEAEGWKRFKRKQRELSESYKDGYVLLCDITDFYNQINIHRVQNILSEAAGGFLDENTKILEAFLLSLNKKTSRGIPVGPGASILLAEAIMSDIEKMILGFTRDFVRYVDDIVLFFKDKSRAEWVLHELSYYLYTSHRLVFSGSKTKIMKTSEYLKNYYYDEEVEESKAKHW